MRRGILPNPGYWLFVSILMVVCLVTTAAFLGLLPSSALIIHAAYYYLFILFAIWSALLIKFILRRRRLIAEGWRKHLIPAFCILLLSAYTQVHEPDAFRIFGDESEFLVQARLMHEDRIAGLPAMSYNIGGRSIHFFPGASLRPPLFSFLLSVFHDLFGYQPNHVFLLNALLGLCLLYILYALSFFWTRDRWISLTPPLLIAFFPLFSQVVNSGGYDVLNALFILFSIYFGSLFLKTRTEEAWVLFLYSSLVLCHCRTESNFFLLAPVFLWIYFWFRIKRRNISLPTAISPVFVLYPLIWLSYYRNTPNLHYTHLRADGTSLFGFEHWRSNLSEALHYLLIPSLDSTASFPVVILCALGMITIIFPIIFRYRNAFPESAIFHLLYFFPFVVGCFLITQANFWSALTDARASRFILPTLLVATLTTLPMLLLIKKKARRFDYFFLPALASILFIFSTPSSSRQVATRQLIWALHHNWAIDALNERFERPERILVVSSSSIHFIAHLFSGTTPQWILLNPDSLPIGLAHGLFEAVIFPDLERRNEVTGQWEQRRDDINELRKKYDLEILDTILHHHNLRSHLYLFTGKRNPDGSVEPIGLGYREWPSVETAQESHSYLMRAFGL
ncbi:MAG: glycosyltransferase family 39 protein [Opitutales bacterium]|nr:glycosyltransferase family 39 protein [Opitutales bacterium]